MNMKLALRSLVAAAALATVGLANAATASVGVGEAIRVTAPNGSGREAALTLLSGSSTLYFSNGTADPIKGTPTTYVGGLVGALNTASVQLSSVDGAAVTETYLPIGSKYPYLQRAKVSIETDVARVTADTTTGQITLVNAFGGAKQTASLLTGVLEGGDAAIFNLEIDLVNKRVYADAVALADYPDEYSDWLRTYTRMHVWDFETITGATTIPPAALLAATEGNTAALTDLGVVLEGGSSATDDALTFRTENILGGLKATADGFNFFAYALGMFPYEIDGASVTPEPYGYSIGHIMLADVNNQAAGWGSLKLSSRFQVEGIGPLTPPVTPAVPEPSAYAMVAIGLVGVGIGSIARRRRASKR